MIPKILVVNDNFPLLKMLADMLKVYFDVKEANNGLEALDIVMAHQRNYFDAILMDISMPLMDGFESCQKIN
jgi:putative two-component system response regulator